MHHQHNATPCAILALDLGTTTGWALSLPDHSVTHGFVSFKPQRFEGGGMRYRAATPSVEVHFEMEIA